MLKLTLWFDKFDTTEKHLEQLHHLISTSNNQYELSIVHIHYNKDIGKLLLKNKDIISNISFSNLDRDTIITYNKQKYTTGFIRGCEVFAHNSLDDKILLNLGDFELEEKKDENMVS